MLRPATPRHCRLGLDFLFFYLSLFLLGLSFAVRRCRSALLPSLSLLSFIFLSSSHTRLSSALSLLPLLRLPRHACHIHPQNPGARPPTYLYPRLPPACIARLLMYRTARPLPSYIHHQPRTITNTDIIHPTSSPARRPPYPGAPRRICSHTPYRRRFLVYIPPFRASRYMRAREFGAAKRTIVNTLFAIGVVLV